MLKKLIATSKSKFPNIVYNNITFHISEVHINNNVIPVHGGTAYGAMRVDVVLLVTENTVFGIGRYMLRSTCGKDHIIISNNVSYSYA